MTKACSKCGAVKPVEAFGLEPRVKSGRQAQCKTCMSAYRRTDKALAQQANYRKATAGRRDAQQAEYRTAHREETRVRNRARYAADPDRHKTRAKIYAATNPVEVNTSHAKSRNRPEARLAAIERAKRWAADNPEQWKELRRSKEARRRGRKYEAAQGRITSAELLSRWDYFGGRCWICHEPAAVWDHVKPLARGGAHLLSNLRPGCRPCNAHKGARWPFVQKAA
jgi:5-methylcytosine-specific restriction endonuclease McrA